MGVARDQQDAREATRHKAAQEGRPAGTVTSVGSRGDSYDNALAESVIGLFKTELIRKQGPWKNLDSVEYATLEWVDWFNHRRLLEPIDNIPPAELEEEYYRHAAQREQEALKQMSLH